MADLREALETGYDALDAEEVVDDASSVEEAAPVEQAAPEPVEAAETTETAEQKADRTRDEAGRFAAEKKAKAAEKVVAKTAATAQAKPAAAVTQPVAATTAPVLKAPQSWKANEREAWSKVPPEAQAAILRRDRETAIALKQAADREQATQPIQEALRPYEAIVRASGLAAPQYIGSVMQTVHALASGPQHVKADTLASLVMQFGPDLLQQVPDGQGGMTCALERALVAKMSGRQAQQPQAQPQQAPFRDPRLDTILQQSAQRQASVAEQQVESFAATHEFLSDVSDTMQTIIDGWAKQGKTELSDGDLDRAYNIACNMDQDVAATLEQRKRAASVAVQQQAANKARTAASTVRSSPTVANATQPADRRAALEDAYDKLSG